MLLLTSTTDKLQVITASAVSTIAVHASFIDNNAGTITPGRTNSLITTAATTDVVAAPAASTYRNVKSVNIRNTNTTTSNVVTVRHTDGTTAIDLFSYSLAAGEVLTYVEGMGWDVFSADGSHKAQGARTLLKVLASDQTGQLITTVQPWFPTAGALSVQGNTTYQFEGKLQLTHGTTTHTTAQSFGGTAVLSYLTYKYWLTAAASGAIATTSSESIVNVATAFVMNATAAVGETRVELLGTVRVTTGGTFIPQYTFSASPTGTVLSKKHSFFRMWAVGDINAESIGTWT